MSCRDYDNTIVDVARGVAGDAEAEALLRHAAGCADCGLRLRQEQALTAGLRALDAATRGEGASARVEADLLAAFAARQGSAMSAEGPRFATWRPWMAAAAALAVVVLGVVVVSRDRVAGPTTPPLDARPVRGAQALDVLRPAVQGRRVRLEGSQVEAVAVGVSRVAAGAPVEVPGPFVPWPGAAALPAFENGELVRTELPASVLPLLGIDGATRTAQATVAVDVVVGQDGFARAVRLARH